MVNVLVVPVYAPVVVLYNPDADRHFVGLALNEPSNAFAGEVPAAVEEAVVLAIFPTIILELSVTHKFATAVAVQTEPLIEDETAVVFVPDP